MAASTPKRQNIDMEPVTPPVDHSDCAPLSELRSSQNEVMALRIRVMTLEEQARQMSQRMDAMETYSRRGNVRMKVPPAKNPSNETAALNFRAGLGKLDMPDIRIDRVHYTGHKDRKGNKDEVIARPTFWSDRERILTRARDLKKKHGPNSSDAVTVYQDFPPGVDQKRRYMRQALDAARRDPKIDNSQLKGDQLTIGERTYSTATLHQAPTGVTDQLTARDEKRDGNTCAFFGRFSVLSNWYQRPFQHKGVTYSCSEQLYFAQAAEGVDDEESHARIMAADDPAKIKRAGELMKKNMNGPSRKYFDNNKRLFMITALRAKFGAPTPMRDYLQDTGSMELREASATDLYWGTGMSLRDDAVLTATSFSGKNHLGHLLQRVRLEVCGEDAVE